MSDDIEIGHFERFSATPNTPDIEVGPSPCPLCDTSLPTVADFESDIVPHEQLEIHRRCINEFVAERSKLSKKGTSAKAAAFLLLGGSGAGKSTLLDLCQDDWGGNAPVRTDFGLIRHVVRVSVPGKRGMKQFVAAIMDQLGYPMSGRASANELSRRIASLCGEMSVKVMMIDEAHNLLHETRDAGDDATLEFVKELLNQLPCQVVMAGLPRLVRLKRFNQMERRGDDTVHLKPYSWRTVDGRAEFHASVFLMCRNLAVPTDPSTDMNELGKRLYCATGGHIGLVSRYLSRALRTTITNRARMLDLGLLAEVHDSLNTRILVDDDDLGGPDDEPIELIPAIDHSNPFRPDADLASLWELMKERRRKDYVGVPTDSSLNFDPEAAQTIGKVRPKAPTNAFGR